MPSSWRDPTMWSAIFTSVIAIATLAYVYFTLRLWQETRKSADAANKSAEAAKQSADATVQAAAASSKSTELLAALNRPYMGVVSVELRPDPHSQNNPVWSIAWSVGNFGNLPATDVRATADLLLEGKSLLLNDKGTVGAEVFPQSDPLTTITNLKWGQGDRENVMNGQSAFVVRVLIDYAGSDGRRYCHSADARFNRGYGTFSIQASHTQQVGT